MILMFRHSFQSIRFTQGTSVNKLADSHTHTHTYVYIAKNFRQMNVLDHSKSNRTTQTTLRNRNTQYMLMFIDSNQLSNE